MDLGPFGAFDQLVGIRVRDESLASALERLFAGMLPRGRELARSGATTTWFEVVAPSEGSPGIVRKGGKVLIQSGDHALILGRLLWGLNQHVIRSTTDRLLFHAAGAVIQGAGVLIPAEMEAGKTTLVAGLLQRGASYLTDEAASVSDGLVLEGYAKPLSVDPGSWELLEAVRPSMPLELAPYYRMQWQVPPTEVATVASSAPLKLIVLRRYVPDTPLRVGRVRPGVAVERTVSTVFSTDRAALRTEQVRDLAGVLERVPIFEVIGSDLNAACEAVEDSLAEVSR